MKKLLTSASLAIIILAAIAEAARSAGVPAPATLNLGNAFLAVSFSTFALVLLSDYGSKARPITLRRAQRIRLTVPARHSIAAAHHHVYAIRRGAEAARLAHVPARMTPFPRRSVRFEKAA